jgi:mono/diheme cytochrome c family protein
MTAFRKTVATATLVIGIAAIGGAAFVYSGFYNVGADDPHTRPVFAALETLRQRSITMHAKDIQVPDLDDPKKIAEGAEHYSAMCTGCHLAPGMKASDSEIRPGLYPQPPNLAERGVHDPKEAFWVIKHGIKMSAMPAWGSTHDDESIWNMVAFVHKLPQMSVEEYQRLTGSAGSEGHTPGHTHDHKESGHEHGSESGADGHEHDEGSHEAEDASALSLDGLKAGAAPDAEAVAKAFRTALENGDRAGVLAQLAADVTISEGGHTQSRDEYASGHLAEDIAFLKGARSTLVSLGSMPMDDSAMVGSETEIVTTAKGKPVTLRSREMLDLKRDGAHWKIVRVRWQSEPLETKGG